MPKALKMTEAQLNLLRTLHSQELLNGEIAHEMNISNSTVTKYMQRLRLKPHTLGMRRLKALNARNEAMRNAPRVVEPVDDSVTDKPTMRPAAIAGPDLLAQRIRAGLR